MPDHRAQPVDKAVDPGVAGPCWYVQCRLGGISLANRSTQSVQTAVSITEELQIVAEEDIGPEVAAVTAAWDVTKADFCEQQGMSAHDRAWIRGVRAIGILEQTVLF